MSNSELTPSVDNREGRFVVKAILNRENPAEGFLSSEEWSAVAVHLSLSGRELSVTRLIFEGQTRDNIARKLGCAQGTVRVYVDRVFEKLNVRDRLGLALRVIRVHRETAP